MLDSDSQREVRLPESSFRHLCQSSPWLLPLRTARATATLLCVPYAGGGASIFASWTKYLPATLNVVGVQLPGRENRTSEAPLTNIEDVLMQLAPAVSACVPGPIMLFGHSNGALIAYELAQWLHARTAVRVLRLYVSASRAPHLSRARCYTHQLPEPQFKRYLHQLGGTPREVLEDAEVMRLMLPMLRGDICMNETYRCRHEAPLRCDITAFAGSRDETVSAADLSGWARHTRGTFTLHWVRGDHFFIKEPAAVTQQIRLDLAATPPSDVSTV